MQIDDLRTTQSPVVMGPCVRRDDDVGTHALAISRPIKPEFCQERSALSSEGAGNAGRPMRPRSRVRRSKVKKHTRSSGHTGITRHSLRNGFNGFLRALPGDRAFLPPSPLRSLLLKNLTPASGRQDHTPSPSASSALVRSTIHVHRTHPASVTIAIRPSSGTGWLRIYP
jgi:hypothetical protein